MCFLQARNATFRRCKTLKIAKKQNSVHTVVAIVAMLLMYLIKKKTLAL